MCNLLQLGVSVENAIIFGHTSYPARHIPQMPRAHASYHGSAWVFRQDHHKRVIVSKRRFPSAAAWNSCHKSFTVESLKKEIYIYLDQDKIQASLDRDIAPLKPDDQSKLSNGTIQEGVV